jgi:large subunit ribosomal protein L21
MYAVIATGGKQYRVQEGDVLDIERLDATSGAAVEFNEVLAIGDGADIQCGNPFINSAVVEAEIVEHFRGKKLTVFKMKRRKGYRKKHGHRQELTKIQITKIPSSVVA